MLEQLHAARPVSLSASSEAPSPPQSGSSESVQPVRNASQSALVLEGQVHADRGRHQGGRRRLVAEFMKPLAKGMADNTPMQKAAAKLGLRFSRRDVKRIYQLKEFVSLYRAYRRLFNSEAWGRPNEEEVLQKLILREDVKSPRPPKPRGAQYVSRPLRRV
jgi:hypothetical protein